MLARALASHLGRARSTGTRAFAQHVAPIVDPNADMAPPSYGDNAEIGEISGNPTNFLGRKVRIMASARTASQQGQGRSIGAMAKGPVWKIEFETGQKWINPLMGWTSTSDTAEQIRPTMYFHTKEEAMLFAEKMGWRFEVEEPQMRRTDRQKRFAGYGDNFSVKRGGLPEGGLRSENAGKPLAGEEIKMADLGMDKGKGEVSEPAKKAGRPKKDPAQKKDKS